MKTSLAIAAITASLFCSSAQAVVIPAGTTFTFEFTSLPFSQPNTLQVDPAAGFLDMGVTVPPGAELAVALYGNPGDTMPFITGVWPGFDGTGFNPDRWFDGTGAVRLAASGEDLLVSHITAGWVGFGTLHYTNLVAEVPEPSTLGLIGLGLLGLGAMKRRRRGSQ
jgi:PEP-CTERM motif